MAAPSDAGASPWLAVLILLVGACSSSPGVPGADPRNGFTEPDPLDLRSLDGQRVEAFEQMHRKFSAEYAFGEWKQIDWDALHDRILPRIRAAGDDDAYFLALHQYFFAIPDGHIGVKAALQPALAVRQSGGGFGVAMAELDDGRIVAAGLIPEGPAVVNGIERNAEIVGWGGLPAAAAVDQVNLGALALPQPVATAEHLRLDQVRFLARAPVGTTVQVVFRNPGAATTSTALLTATDDQGASLDLVNFAPSPPIDLANPVVTCRTLPSGVGYVHIAWLLDLNAPGTFPEWIRVKVRDALTQFTSAGVPGVIVDLRGNHGGSDDLAAALCGLFRKTPAFYERTEFYDKRDGRFLLITKNDHGDVVDALMMEPDPAFIGPVAALIDAATISSGEGVAMCIGDLPRGATIGFHGTAGSFGMVGGYIAMPGGVEVTYPFGRSVDAQGVVQLDSRGGVGGVTPTIRVPRSLTNVARYAQGEDVVLERAEAWIAAQRR